MALWEKKNREEADESGKKSLLYSLWYKMTAREEKPEKGEVPEEAPAAEEAAPALTLTAKLGAPEEIMGYYILYCQDRGIDVSKVLIEDFCQHPLPEDGVLKQAFSQIDAKAMAAVKDHQKATEQALKKADDYISGTLDPETEALPKGLSIPHEALPAERITPPMDGQALIFCTPDWSAAWCIVLPSLGDGKSVTEKELLEQLELKGVTYGIDRSAVRDLVKEEGQFLLSRVAVRKDPVPGEDGRVIDHYPRSTGTPQIVEDEHGIVDFENLNWLVPIEEGTVICDIIEPTMGVPGINIRGDDIRAYNGKSAILPKGENVVPSSDGKSLVSRITGQISFRDGRFHVNNVTVIKGDVDLSTGSLDARGDIIIHGNVLAGLSVKATGDITIGGVVGGSQITAGGSIVVNRGMNGNLIGGLTAGKDIVCKYMENATVHAGGDVKMDSIVNCDISASGKVIATSGRGVIIGGTVRSMGGVEAKTIGNIAGRITIINLGPTPQFLAEKEQAELELGELHQQQAMAGATAISQMKIKVLEKKLEQFEHREAAAAQRQIVTSKLLPIVQVTINNVNKNIIESYGICRIYLDPKEALIKIMNA